MNRFSWLLPMLLALLSGCRTDSTGADTRRYPCVRDDECATGFVCRANFCQEPQTPPAPPADAGEPSGNDGGPSRPDGGGTDGSGSDGGGTDGSGSDGGGMDAGPPPGGTDGGGSGASPTKLGFTTASPALTAGVCSTAVTVELQTANGTAAATNGAVTVSLSAPSGTTFYQDASCTSAISSATVAPGTSQTTFYVRATVAPSTRVTASAAFLTSAQQEATVRAAAPAGLAFVSTAQPLDVGACSVRTDLELRDAYQNPATATSSQRVTPSGSGLYFYSDFTCDTALTDVTFAPGTSRASFYFRSRPSGSSVRVTASGAGLGTASQDQTVRPLQTSVRTGTCDLTSEQEDCTISPPQTDVSKTMLLFQAPAGSPYNTSPAYLSVRCALTSTSNIRCTRSQNPGSNRSTITLSWKTVEMATGLRVQHLSTQCTSSTTTLSTSFNGSVNTAHAFLLVSSDTTGSSAYDGDDFFTAKLASPTRVDIQFSSACGQGWRGSVQVVEMDGARVTRDTLSLGTGRLSATDTGLPAVDLSTSALLFTYRISNTSSNRLCDRMLRGELSSATTTSFSRGSENSNCGGTNVDEIAWERIDFGPTAQVQNKFLDFPVDSRSPSPAPTLTSVDTSRTVAFSSAQALNGQAGGETSYIASQGSPFNIGEALAPLLLTSPTTLSAQRGYSSTTGRLKMNVSVVQFEP